MSVGRDGGRVLDRESREDFKHVDLPRVGDLFRFTLPLMDKGALEKFHSRNDP